MLSIIVAVSLNEVIGSNNEIPWRLSTDLRNFKQRTLGHTVVMGRRTYDSILKLGKSLPGRENFVYTRQHSFFHTGIQVMETGDLERFVGSREEVFVIGGSEIFKLTLPLAKRVYLTRVRAVIYGDAFFHDGPYLGWPVIAKGSYRQSSTDEYPFDTITYERP